MRGREADRLSTQTEWGRRLGSHEWLRKRATPHIELASMVNSLSAPAASRSKSVEKPCASYRTPRRSATSDAMISPTYSHTKPPGRTGSSARTAQPLWRVLNTSSRTDTSRCTTRFRQVGAHAQAELHSRVGAVFTGWHIRELLGRALAAAVGYLAAVGVFAHAAQQKGGLRLHLNPFPGAIIAAHARAQVDDLRERLVVQLVDGRDGHAVLPGSHRHARPLARDIVDAEDVRARVSWGREPRPSGVLSAGTVGGARIQFRPVRRVHKVLPGPASHHIASKRHGCRNKQARAVHSARASIGGT
eukprot:scaffold496_cov119-Isochrysis_galbana.AAC.5